MRRPNVTIGGLTHARTRGGLAGETACGESYRVSGWTMDAASMRATPTKAPVDCMACIAGRKARGKRTRADVDCMACIAIDTRFP